VNGLSHPPLATLATSTPSTPHTTAATQAFGSTSKEKKGMQLGASKVPASASMGKVSADWAEEAAAEAEIGQSNPWGSDDLMDVNADQDDWSAFETAAAPASFGLGFEPPIEQPVAKITTPDADGWDDYSSSPPGDTWGSEPRISTTKSSPHKSTPKPSNLHTHTIQRPSSAQSHAHSDGWGDPIPSRGTSPAPVTTTSTIGMTKEEKAAEMARRKEERKQVSPFG